MVDKALRYNDNKPRWGLVDFKSLIPLIDVLDYGTRKYAKDNWKLGLKNDEILESLARHLFALMDGEDVDQESKQLHIGHIMANAMFYSYNQLDDKDTTQLNLDFKE